MQALTEAETNRLLSAASGPRLYLPVLLAVATGARRGEILALSWQEVDLEAGVLSINRSLEQTAGRLAFKEPKTIRSRRRVALPRFAWRLWCGTRGSRLKSGFSWGRRTRIR